MLDGQGPYRGGIGANATAKAWDTQASESAWGAEAIPSLDALAARGWSGAGQCGIATGMLNQNPDAMGTFCRMGLEFWWNWAPKPVDEHVMRCARHKFIPMIWGTGGSAKQTAWDAGQGWSFLMGYNEPDLWGPPPNPGDPFMSSGSFAPTFHCGSRDLALEWQAIVNAFKAANPRGILLSPSMADPSVFASAGSDVQECMKSPQTFKSHMKFCTGWMQCFKQSVMKLPCGSTNCWDAIDVLQFHAYEYDAEKLVQKVKRWEHTWQEDLNGFNGRRKKTLWLTEFAHAGTTDSEDPSGVARDFMKKTVGYLIESPHVSGWSWFSETFATFEIDEIPPATKFWNSELINSRGELTALGRTYAGLCDATPPQPPR